MQNPWSLGGGGEGEGEKGRVYSATYQINCINNRFHIGESSTSKGATRRWEGFRARCRPFTFPGSAFPTAFNKNALYSFCTPLNKWRAGSRRPVTDDICVIDIQTVLGVTSVSKCLIHIVPSKTKRASHPCLLFTSTAAQEDSTRFNFHRFTVFILSWIFADNGPILKKLCVET